MVYDKNNCIPPEQVVTCSETFFHSLDLKCKRSLPLAKRISLAAEELKDTAHGSEIILSYQAISIFLDYQKIALLPEAGELLTGLPGPAEALRPGVMHAF